MIPRFIEIEGTGRHLALERGFMLVKAEGEELGRVPLDDVAAVIATGHGLTYSNNLLVALVERGASIVLCGRNFAPAAILWPIDGHHRQSGRMRDQIGASKRLSDRLWQQLVVAKIANQAAVVEALGGRGGGLRKLSGKVRSGDPENIEAQAARRYWPLVMGTDFRRDRDRPGTNGMLNYGYAVLRAATARSVAGAGLHPSIGLHHRNGSNPMLLVDDLMEPFRPLIDLAVARLLADGCEEVNRDCKMVLGAAAAFDMHTTEGRTPLITCLQRLAVSLAQAYGGERDRLELPLAPLPLELPALPARIADDDGA